VPTFTVKNNWNSRATLIVCISVTNPALFSAVARPHWTDLSGLRSREANGVTNRVRLIDPQFSPAFAVLEHT
jgi:hypothetical protein